jgi:HSP20 family protein
MAIDRWRGGLARGGAREPRGLERAFDEWFGSPFFRNWSFPRLFGDVQGYGPPVDMVDKKDGILVRMDLPGMRQQDIDVSVDQGMLTIRGERKAEEAAERDEYYCCERWSGSFERAMTLPAGVDPERIEASFRNGVLEVHIPKTAEAKGRKVEIKAAA